MLDASRARIEGSLSSEDLVLDVGGWAKPFPRADWVLDLMPYETRGLYGPAEPTGERFDASRWVQMDICEGDWPFADGQFDFAICSHTLEDIRDPIRVCAELNRVAKAGYIEVPSRLEEQSLGVQHEGWVGWSHHRWLVDTAPGEIEFVFKPHVVHGAEQFYFPAGFFASISAEERVETLFWEGVFEYRERIFMTSGELDDYLASFVSAELAERGWRGPSGRIGRSARRFARRLRGA